MKAYGQNSINLMVISSPLGLPRWLSGKESACQAGNMGLIPEPRRFPGEGNGNPLQYSCPGKSRGQRSLKGYSPWCHNELGMTYWLSSSSSLYSKQNYIKSSFIHEWIIYETQTESWTQRTGWWLSKGRGLGERWVRGWG